MEKFFSKNILAITLTFFINNSLLFTQVVELKPESNMGITKEMFSDVNIRDAKAIIEIWTKMIHEKISNDVKTTTFIYDDIQKLIKDINDEKVDYVFLNVPQYLKYKSSLKLKPYYGTLVNKKKYFDLYLIIGIDKNIKSFSELKNSTIAIQCGRFETMGNLFLDYLCLKNGVQEKEKFFKKILYEDNASKTILGTFFGKTDACIVTSSTFEITSEMNPQVKNSLRILNKKENLTNDLFCFRNNLPENEKEKAVGFGNQVDADPKTSQVYKIFKIDGSYLINKSDLAPTVELWESYNNLKNKK
ncbi:MAG: PhnD/SsuA/transferrin family substrate-binding protein [Ignavibacteriae bacterium]|nr:PhnD/SsuA/transferrin family substrate-binding protein [Ignavibacteriota bacterium]